jgi:hypothetical protein
LKFNLEFSEIGDGSVGAIKRPIGKGGRRQHHRSEASEGHKLRAANVGDLTSITHDRTASLLKAAA